MDIARLKEKVERIEDPRGRGGICGINWKIFW
jgi:4-aminobutyrate aminotransferase-like enzyme